MNHTISKYTPATDGKESLQITQEHNQPTQSDSIKELATALSKAQSVIKSAHKKGVNHFYKKPDGTFHTYSTFEDTWEACREPLTKNGLSIVQTFGLTQEGIVLITKLIHSSGEWLCGMCPLINLKGDMQGLMSAATYAKRYSLSSICGIASDEDDDANTADGKKTTPLTAKTKTYHKDYEEPPLFDPELGWTKTRG